MNIWNRAERVSEELMPSRIIECFAEWKAEEMAKLDSLIKQRQKIEAQRGTIKQRIKREEINLELAVTKFNNRKKVA
jgi:hypothetical protein